MQYHVFFALGTNPQATQYHLAETPDESRSHCFVLAALVALDYAGLRAACDRGEVVWRPVLTERNVKQRVGQALHAEVSGIVGASHPAAVALESALNAAEDAQIRLADVPSLSRIIADVAQSPPGDEVLVELTNGLRTVSNSFFVGTMLMEALGGARLVGAPYAEFQKENASTPIYDLSRQLEVVKWAEAARAVERSLDIAPLRALVAPERRRLRRTLHEAGMDAAAKRRVEGLPGLLVDVEAPLTIGWTRAVDEALQKLDGTWEELGDALAPYVDAGPGPHVSRVLAFAQARLVFLRDRAAEVTPECLDGARLRHDLRLVERLEAAQRTSDALTLLRETWVNAQILADETEMNWLSARVRGSAEARLHTHPNGKLFAAWRKVSDARNAANHGGFNERHTQKPKKLADAVHEGLTSLRNALGWSKGADTSVPDLALLAQAGPALRTYLANAFSAAMLPADAPEALVEFKRIGADEARECAEGAESAVGHADVAQRMTEILHMPVEVKRQSITLELGDRVLIAQSDAGRLPEGATLLPAQAGLTWILATRTR